MSKPDKKNSETRFEAQKTRFSGVSGEWRGLKLFPKEKPEHVMDLLIELVRRSASLLLEFKLFFQFSCPLKLPLGRYLLCFKNELWCINPACRQFRHKSRQMHLAHQNTISVPRLRLLRGGVFKVAKTFKVKWFGILSDFLELDQHPFYYLGTTKFLSTSYVSQK